MNKSIVSGYVLEDPRRKVSNSGSAILEFPMNTQEDYLDKTGTKRSRIIRHNIVCYGKLAENNELLVKKDALVIVEGSTQNATFEKSDGTQGFRSEIVAKNVETFPVNQAQDSSTAKTW